MLLSLNEQLIKINKILAKMLGIKSEVTNSSNTTHSFYGEITELTSKLQLAELLLLATLSTSSTSKTGVNAIESFAKKIKKSCSVKNVAQFQITKFKLQIMNLH